MEFGNLASKLNELLAVDLLPFQLGESPVQLAVDLPFPRLPDLLQSGDLPLGPLDRFCDGLERSLRLFAAGCQNLIEVPRKVGGHLPVLLRWLGNSVGR